jgi:allantoinase
VGSSFRLRNPEVKDSMAQAFRSTRLATREGLRPRTLVVEQGVITEVLSWEAGTDYARLSDFGELVVLPGLVDTHVHMNDPGRTEWEGFFSATRAAAAGGVTTLVDMPLNSIPETVHREALETKRRAAAGQVWVDWAAWGGVVRGNAREIAPLAAAGVPGFKCFLIHSGIDGFGWVEENDLRLALKELVGTGLPLLAHAEVAGPVERATEALRTSDWRRYSTYLASRPDRAETEAIQLLLRLAEEFDHPIHIVHLASCQALPLLREARSRGVPVTVETCTQYLWFVAEEIPDGATEFKCAPPIRSAANREALWDALEEGTIEMVTTDHSPCPPEMKARSSGNFDQAWGGIASLGLALPVLWTGMCRRGLPLERAAEWMAANPARLAGLQQKKGALEPGLDADFLVFDPDVEWRVGAEDLHFRHPLSPYLGATLRGRVRETWLGGACIFSGREWHGKPSGRELVHQ